MSSDYYRGMFLPKADEELLRRSAGLLEELASRHGLRDMRLGEDPGELIVTVEEGHTYFDVAQFELEAEALLRRHIVATPSGAAGAHPRGRLSIPSVPST